MIQVFAVLQSLENKPSDMDKLQSCVIGMESISAPSFRKIPLRLSRPAAFDVLVLFKISKTDSIDTWLNVKVLFPILRLV